MALAPIQRISTPTEGTPSAGTYAADVVAIVDPKSGAQVLEAARPLRASVAIVGELMEHPLEDGSVIADHFVQKPTEIDLPLVIAGPALKQTFADLRQLYDAGTLLTVMTRTGAYANMVLQGVPHDETPETIDAVVVAVRFREARFVTATYGGLAPAKVKNKAKASTKKRGAQQTTTANAAKADKAGAQYKGSALHRLFGGR